MPEKLQPHFNENALGGYAAALLAHGEDVIEALTVKRRGETGEKCLYVLTNRLLIRVEVVDNEPSTTVWKIADIASISPKDFVAEAEFGGTREVGFDALELQVGGESEPLRVPAPDSQTTHADRAAFLGALWQAWVRA